MSGGSSDDQDYDGEDESDQSQEEPKKNPGKKSKIKEGR